MTDENLCVRFLQTVERVPDRVAFRWRAGEEDRQLTFAEYQDLAARTARYLGNLGVAKDDAVLIFLGNRPEFEVLDTAALFRRAVPMSIYPSSSAKQIAQVIKATKPRVVFVENAAQAELMAQAAATAGVDLERVVTVNHAGETTPDSYSFRGLAQLPGESLVDLAEEVRAEDQATVLFTSGTTGTPKGVVVTHANVIHAHERFEKASGHSWDGLRTIAYLPHAHSGVRCGTHWPQLLRGLETTSCDSLARLPEVLVQVQPHFWWGAPRSWEKQRSAIEAMLAGDPAAQAAFEDARQLGLEMLRAKREGAVIEEETKKAWEAAREAHIVPVLRSMGMGEVLMPISGSAPMPESLQEWWLSLGLPVSDVYGSSETLMLSWDPIDIKPGTAGKPLDGMQLRIAEDGEILVKGKTRILGYYDDPGANSEYLDEDGWAHTGDVGQFDENGNLQILGRKKEIIVPSSGHNVSPIMLEAELLNDPLVGQVCVVGSGRPFCGALIALDKVMLGGSPELQAVAGTPDQQRSYIADHVRSVNADFPPAEQVRAFAIIDEEWTFDSVFLTATGKMKRSAIYDHYADLIDDMYATTDGKDLRVATL